MIKFGIVLLVAALANGQSPAPPPPPTPAPPPPPGVTDPPVSACYLDGGQTNDWTEVGDGETCFFVFESPLTANYPNAKSQCEALGTPECPTRLPSPADFVNLVALNSAEYINGGPYWAEGRYNNDGWYDGAGNPVIFPGPPYSVDTTTPHNEVAGNARTLTLHFDTNYINGFTKNTLQRQIICLSCLDASPVATVPPPVVTTPEVIIVTTPAPVPSTAAPPPPPQTTPGPPVVTTPHECCLEGDWVAGVDGKCIMAVETNAAWQDAHALCAAMGMGDSCPAQMAQVAQAEVAKDVLGLTGGRYHMNARWTSGPYVYTTYAGNTVTSWPAAPISSGGTRPYQPGKRTTKIVTLVASSNKLFGDMILTHSDAYICESCQQCIEVTTPAPVTTASTVNPCCLGDGWQVGLDGEHCFQAFPEKMNLGAASAACGDLSSPYATSHLANIGQIANFMTLADITVYQHWIVNAWQPKTTPGFYFTYTSDVLIIDWPPAPYSTGSGPITTATGNRLVTYDSKEDFLNGNLKLSNPYAFICQSSAECIPTTTAATTTAVTTSAVTTSAVTTSAVTTSAVTTSAVTTSAVTTSAVTTSAVTTSAVTTSAVTTSAVTTSVSTTVTTTAATTSVTTSVSTTISTTVTTSVSTTITTSVTTSVSTSVTTSVTTSVSTSVTTSVTTSVSTSVTTSVTTSVSTTLTTSVTTSVSTTLTTSVTTSVSTTMTTSVTTSISTTVTTTASTSTGNCLINPKNDWLFTSGGSAGDFYYWLVKDTKMSWTAASAFCQAENVECPQREIQLISVDYARDLYDKGLLGSGRTDKYHVDGALDVSTNLYVDKDGVDITVYPGAPYTPDTTKPYYPKTTGVMSLYLAAQSGRFRGDGNQSANRYFICQAKNP